MLKVTSSFQALLPVYVFIKVSKRDCCDSSLRGVSKASSGWVTCTGLHATSHMHSFRLACNASSALWADEVHVVLDVVQFSEQEIEALED